MSKDELSPGYPTLAQWLSGASANIPPPPQGYWQHLLDEATTQRVECLLLERLRLSGCAPVEVLADLKSRASGQAVVSMALGSETRRVLAELGRLGIPGILLKGNALAYWAYANPMHRACSDVDVLVPQREDADRLASALASLGYECAEPSGQLVAYERMCRRRLSDEWWLEVDIHWRLNNTPLFSDVFRFEELAHRAVELPALAANARGLCAVHALLHAASHRAANISNNVSDQLRWLYDFVVLGELMSPADWDELESVTRERHLAGVMADGLKAAGLAFGHVWPDGLIERLEAAMKHETLDPARLGSFGYSQRMAWHALPSMSSKARWVWQRLFPSRDYLTYLYEVDGSYPRLLMIRASRAWRKLMRDRHPPANGNGT